MENKKMTEVFGHKCIEFKFFDRDARLILPSGEKNGKWLLKTEYANAFPALETEMLRRGYHVAYVQNRTRWGCKEDDDMKARFADFLHTEYGLSKKCVPVGMSCGGLQAVYFAARHPDRVAALYLDAPVMNLLSCPFGVGTEIGDRDIMTEEFIRHTGMTLSEMINYRNHPIDNAPILQKNGIPIILVSGDADTVVPYHENGAHLEALYKSSGTTIEVYMKEGGDHHPHGLPDNTPIIEFIERYY